MCVGDHAFFPEDFVSTNPDGLFVHRAAYLPLVPALPTVSQLKGDDVTIRVLGDFAIVHTHISWRWENGIPGHGRFADNYANATAAGNACQPTSPPILMTPSWARR